MGPRLRGDDVYQVVAMKKRPGFASGPFAFLRLHHHFADATSSVVDGSFGAPVSPFSCWPLV